MFNGVGMENLFSDYVMAENSRCKVVKQLNWQNVMAELLYIGIVAEKGRCYRLIWKCGYRKNLKTHVNALYSLQRSLQSDEIRQKKEAVNRFVDTCRQNREFGKYYDNAFKMLNACKIEETSSERYLKTDELLDALFSDLWKECNQPFPSHKKIYYLLCALHNLPRVYFDANKQGLSGERMPIAEEEALEYAYDNMDDGLKRKYKK